MSIRPVMSALALLAACGPPMVKVEGLVAYDNSMMGTQVLVRAFCAGNMLETHADDNGGYKLEMDTSAGCTKVVLNYIKEGALPVIRVIPMPTPVSPFIVNVKLEPLMPIACGTALCESPDEKIKFGPGRFSRGFGIIHVRQDALKALGATSLDDSGNVVWLLGYEHYDFRDAAGAPVNSFAPPLPGCTELDDTARLMIADTVPATTDQIEMPSFTLDYTSATWLPNGDLGTIWVEYDKLNPVTMMTEKVFEKLLPARIGDLYVDPGFKRAKAYVCNTLSRGGTTGWGLVTLGHSCVSFKVMQQCKNGPAPMRNVELLLQGRGYGFFSRAYTGKDGRACVDLTPSEDPAPVPTNYDYDALAGETFWVDVAANLKTNMVGARTSFEAPRKSGSCREPSGCFQVPTLAVTDPTTQCPNDPAPMP